jgi:multicomponent Na+:H+ antiporter subunit G
MPSLNELFIALLLMVGTFLTFVSALGLIRMPDIFCRMHAAGKAGTLGVVTTILAATLFFTGSDQDVTIRGLLAVVFQFLTTPAATHLLARATYLCEYPLSERTAVNELRELLPSRPDEVFNKE